MQYETHISRREVGMADVAPGPAGDTALRRVAVLLTGAVIVFALISLRIGPGAYPLPGVVSDPAENGAWTLVIGLCFGVSGLLVTAERPRNPIGWILIISAFLGSLSEVLGIYGTRALADPTVDWPLGLICIWAAGWLWLPGFTLPFAVLPQLYPDGRVIGPRWRRPLWTTLVGIACLTVVLAASPDNVDDYVAGTRLPLAWPGWTQPVGLFMLVVAFVGIVAGLVAGLAGLVVRFRRGGPQIRGQVLWIALPILIGGATMFTELSDVALRIWYPAVPVAVVIGVLGYDLLGINVTVRRLLVYLPLALTIALLAGVLTTLIARRTEGAEYGVLIAAVAIAVIVLPLRDALMRGVDRLLYGRARDPLAVIDQLGAADPADPDALLAALAESIRSPGVALRDAKGGIVAVVGAEPDRAVAIPLGRVPGPDSADTGLELLVCPRRAERTLDPNDVRLLTAVTPYLLAALRAQALAREVQAERARVVSAADAERARLRSDLHDGLGPALSGIALGAEAATRMIETDPQAATPLVERLGVEASRAVEEVRRVIDDLRPTALDSAPLAEAVRSAADRVAPAVSVEVDGDLCAVSPDVASTAYRIAAEALTNVAKHSGASSCFVELRVNDDQLTVCVRDDGQGMSDAMRTGVGIESMRRRAGALGGSVAIGPVDPSGTQVLAMLPLRAAIA